MSVLIVPLRGCKKPRKAKPMSIALIESLRAAISFAERAQNAELLGAFQKALLEGQDVIDANLELRDETAN
jgi:hypothetical protein